MKQEKKGVWLLYICYFQTFLFIFLTKDYSFSIPKINADCIYYTSQSYVLQYLQNCNAFMFHSAMLGGNKASCVLKKNLQLIWNVTKYCRNSYFEFSVKVSVFVKFYLSEHDFRQIFL